MSSTSAIDPDLERSAPERVGTTPGPEGMKPIGLVIAAIVVTTVLALPIMVVVGYYTFASVYAIIAGSDFGSETINVRAFITGLVLIVAACLVAMAFVVSLIGRMLSPKRRR